jgi:nucleoside-diphosphate-sugar epimerase
MKVLVTGATGFLGKAIVKALVASGHEVVALARPASEPKPAQGVTFLRGDLRQKGEWCERIVGVDAIVHAAAATSGGFPEQFASTVLATENLLECVDWARLKRFVLISTFSVYDYSAGGSRLDETHPIEPDPSRRDAYTWTKLLQEEAVTAACAQHNVPLVSIRPGAIYGPGKDWDAGAALKAGPFDLVLSPLASMRLTHVDNCADAIVRAVESDTIGAYNIVDDENPTYAAFHRRCRKAGVTGRPAIYVPWWTVALAGSIVRFINSTFLGKRARLPEFLDLPRQRARWRPFRYTNARAKAELGWTPRTGLSDGVAAMVESKCP